MPQQSRYADLPIAAVVPQVLAGLRQGNVVLQAEPGAGKSTGLPLALLCDAELAGKIVMLEPRRLAARSVAERLAVQLGEPLGQRIGLRMRGQTTTSKNTKLEVVTEGVLTRMLQADPLLEDIALVIFDEFHERSLQADLGLALCREVQCELRSDLRLLLMSATLDNSSLDRVLADARLVVCSNRPFPVDVEWLGDVKTPLPARVSRVVLEALSKHPGDILVFLPGVAEIEKTANQLQALLPAKVQLHRLHSGVSQAMQRAATAVAVAEHRRVVLSTSIAETSITIDGVRVVIDAGLERRGRLDASTGAVRLETVMASQASATQRMGRAGRTAAGVCYRLWSQSTHQRREASWQAEILRADLAPLLLELGQWGAQASAQLPWLQPPPTAALSRAQTLLTRLGIWHAGCLTEHGRAAAQLPVHPRLGHMLLWAAKRGAGETACQLAVLLEEQQRNHAEVDLERWLGRPLSKTQATRFKQLQRLLSELAAPSVEASANPSDGVAQGKCLGRAQDVSPGVLLAQAFPDWLALARPGANGRFVLSCGAGAVLDSGQPLAHSQWLAVAQLGGAGREARIFAACSLDLDELSGVSPELFQTQKRLDWDDRAERVVAEQQTCLGALLVKTSALTKVSSSERAVALLAGVRQRGLACLPWTPACREWQARMRWAALLPPDMTQCDWPAVDDQSLCQRLEDWLLPWLDGISSLRALSQLKLLRILQTMLDYQQQRLLDELLPERYTVPSGSSLFLRYAGEQQPVLAVKLQEMFGCTENPTIAKGQIRLKVELLSPARRPVQVTQDLANFWKNSYPAVKKDMAGRYAKHHWPEDPLTAAPTATTKRAASRP